MDKENFRLGNLLKTVRKQKGVTTRKLGELMGYSHSYISSVENGSKLSPSDDFIQKYFYHVMDRDLLDANYYITLINKLADGLYNFEELPVPKNLEIEKFEKENRLYEDVNLYVSEDKSKTMFSEPINDLHYHLSDLNNLKYFKGVTISHEEMLYIENFITDYLINLYNEQCTTIYKLYIEGYIDKDELNRLLISPNNAINKLKNKENNVKDLLDSIREISIKEME